MNPSIPLQGGREYFPAPEFVATLEALYPSVDISTTILECRAWVLSVPKARWKRNGARFLRNWVRREAERCSVKRLESTLWRPGVN